jgi:hypothetical protein
MAGYKRTISDLEKRLAESEQKPCTRRHADDSDDESEPNILARANAKEQLSAYETEMALLRRRDGERESEIARLRDLVRSISNGNAAEGVRLPFSPKI